MKDSITRLAQDVEDVASRLVARHHGPSMLESSTTVVAQDGEI